MGNQSKNNKNFNKKNIQAAYKNSFWIFGIHAVTAALDNPSRIRFDLVTIKSLAPQFAKFSPRIVDKAEFDRILPKGVVHQGVALNVAKNDIILEDIIDDIQLQKKSTILMLDQVSDIHNVGAVLRSSAAFNVDAVIIPEHNSPNENGQMAKAACGALESVPLIKVTNISQTIEKLKKIGFWAAAFDASVEISLNNFSFPDKTLFVFGSEGDGLRKSTKQNCDYVVKLNMSDKMESLNISNAVAVALYQRFISL